MTPQPLDIIPITPGTTPEHIDIPFFYLANNGWYVNTPTLFGIAHAPMREKPKHLADMSATFKLNETKLPIWFIKQVHHFFQQVWEEKHAEAMVFITYNRARDEFRPWIPDQYVSGVSVNYKIEPGAIKRGFEAVGTIHSHCNFGAFHSGTDDHDMSGMPGLHITIGHVQREWPDFAVALSANKQRYDVETIETILDMNATEDKHGRTEAQTWWMDHVKTGAPPWTGKTITYGNTNKNIQAYTKPNTTETKWQTTSRSWYDDDDWKTDLTERIARQKKQVPDLPPGYRQVEMFSNDPAEQQGLNDVFEYHKEEIQLSEIALYQEAVELAYMGFTLSWSINFNPEKCYKWLKEKGYDIPSEDKDAL